MNQDVVIELMQNMFIMILELSAPVMIVSIVIGLLISIFQTITQIQESTLTYVPKIIAGVVTIVVLMPWMFSIVVSNVKNLFENLPSMI